VSGPSAPDVELAVLGDLHGHFELALDRPLLERSDLALCTGDLAPCGGRRRFEEALRQAEELAAAGVLTILGNHDGPTCFTGRRFPKSYLALAGALGDHHVGGRRVDRLDLDRSVVGARPLSCGGPSVRFAVPEREDWDVARWGQEIAELVEQAPCSRVVILSHAGPTGLGAERNAPWGRDFGSQDGDWGDPDLGLALDRVAAVGRAPVAVLAGHMHHRLQGGGHRRPAARRDGVLHVNAAVVPRVDAAGRRAITVVTISGRDARARLEWRAPNGSLETVALDPDG
jgi:uncharacterized protein (TIGR04168 family)